MVDKKRKGLGRIRFADKWDSPSIASLINESTRANFNINNENDIINLLLDSVMSIVQLDTENTIIGFLSLNDYPRRSPVVPGAWEEYVWKAYRALELNSRNTLFICMFCWKAGYSRELVDNLLRSVFMHFPHLEHIAVIKSLDEYKFLSPGNITAETSFNQMKAIEKGASPDKLPSLWVVDRHQICPRLRVRRAVEEDNDDIIPILDDHAPILKQTYGEYYISELVAHPGSRVLLVCEDQDKVAVGVMCLNTQINYKTLEDSYALNPYAGLKHLDDPIDSIDEMRGSFNVDSLTDNVSVRSSSKAISFYSRSYSFFSSKPNLDVPKNLPPTNDENWEGSYVGFLDLLQDEDFEYEIVNIEDDLLRVPRQLSSDSDFKTIHEYREILKFMPQSHESFAEKFDSVGPLTAASVEDIEVTHFTGEPNAFLLELFALSPNLDERYGFDILRAAYEMFPDRDYCVLNLPSNQPPFPLLEHFTLVAPLDNPQRFINETLYVAHVNSIRGKLRVRPAEAHDLQYLLPIVEHSGRREHLLDLFEDSVIKCKLSHRNIYSYVLLSENQPVGVLLTSPLQHGATIRAQFNVSPCPKAVGTDGVIHGAVISPIFEPHYRWFLREVLRQSKFATLFWPLCVLGKGELSLNRNLLSLFNYMVPLYSRLPIPNLTKIAYMDILSAKSAKPLAYCGIIRPITSIPKVNINCHIVVVGSSSTGLAFIETLINDLHVWYLNFTNITLVSENGLSFVTDCLSAAVTCIPRYGRFSHSYMKRVPFITHADVVTGTMVKIDRKRKCIFLKTNKLVFYDTLVLTCGLQFQNPAFKRQLKAARQGKPCTHRRMDDPQYKPDRVTMTSELPRNVMIINEIHRANRCLRKLMALISDTKNTPSRLSTERRILVYGNCIEVYTCISALLEMKINPNNITFIESYDEGQSPRVNCFNDEKIDERVQKKIDSLGIKVYRDCSMVDWTCKRSYVKFITLMSNFQRFNVECFVLFYYGHKDIDEHTFKAMIESGLVYDGGLVIGADFETNDPHIYAAGTCTRYSRRLYADKYLHKYYYSETVGEALAHKFLNRLDPFKTQSKELKKSLLPGYSSNLLQFFGSHTTIFNKSSRHQSECGVFGSHTTIFNKSSRHQSECGWLEVPRFESPLYVYAILPGPLYYLRLRKPGPDIPMEVALSLPHQCHTLETDKDGNLYRMLFSELHIFEGATCLCESKFQPDFYIKLYGKHEKFFNNLFTRYEMNQVDDLNEYANQPWIAALYLFCFNLALETIEDHEVGTLAEIIEKMKANRPNSDKNLTEFEDLTSSMLLNSIPFKGFDTSESQDLGTIRSILTQLVGDRYAAKFIDNAGNCFIKEFPSECGQSTEVRAEMDAYWRAISGNRIVWYYLSQYLHKYHLINPQYQKPKPELTIMPCRL